MLFIAAILLLYIGRSHCIAGESEVINSANSLRHMIKRIYPIPRTRFLNHTMPRSKNSFSQKHVLQPTAPRSENLIILRCDNTEESYDIGTNIKVESRPSKFPISCPCSYDETGKCHNAPHMCVASNTDYHCAFKMENFIISKKGAILEHETLNQISFRDISMAGGVPPTYSDAVFNEWNRKVAQLQSKYKEVKDMMVYDFVISTRMPWDNCFNHLSFQTMPLISLVYEFHRPIWHTATWHASLFGAAMLNLLGVPMKRIIVEQSILAKTVFLPWIPHWLPLKIASVHGIAANLAEHMTQNLLKLSFPAIPEVAYNNSRSKTILDPFNIRIPGFSSNISYSTYLEELTMKVPNVRYIVYISRTRDQTRCVDNEEEVLNSIRSVLNPTYQLIVLGHSVEYQTISLLQQSWQRYARIVNKAIVFMGPHGGGWNNLMFTPPDCHFIEFNYRPNVIKWQPGTDRIRDNFLHGVWAKGGTGKYYIVVPTNRSMGDVNPNVTKLESGLENDDVVPSNESVVVVRRKLKFRKRHRARGKKLFHDNWSERRMPMNQTANQSVIFIANRNFYYANFMTVSPAAIIKTLKRIDTENPDLHLVQ